MAFRTRPALGLATVVAGLLMIVAPVGPAAAYTFPSTNDANRAAGHPHVNQVSNGPGTVTLEFVNTTNSLAYFEYRIDGVEVGTTPHPVVTGDVIHPGVCVDGRSTIATGCTRGPMVRTLAANTTVEVRLALGGERDWDFDWTTFSVVNPTTRADCVNGGWAAYRFANQGQCIRFVNTGVDSRRTDPVRQAARLRTPLGARSMAQPTWWTVPSGRVQVTTRSAVMASVQPPS